MVVLLQSKDKAGMGEVMQRVLRFTNRRQKSLQLTRSREIPPKPHTPPLPPPKPPKVMSPRKEGKLRTTTELNPPRMLTKIPPPEPPVSAEHGCLLLLTELLPPKPSDLDEATTAASKVAGAMWATSDARRKNQKEEEYATEHSCALRTPANHRPAPKPQDWVLCTETGELLPSVNQSEA